MRGDHAIPRRAGDARRSADERDPVPVALGLGQVRVDQVRPTDTLDLRMPTPAQRADDADAVRHEQGRATRAPTRTPGLRRASITISGLSVTTTAGCDGVVRRGAVPRCPRASARPSAVSTTSTGHPSTRARTVVRGDGRRLHYRLVYCGAFRARFRPYFLRSFSREVAGEQARRLQHGTQLGVGGDQRTSDAVADGTRLTGDAAAADLDRHLETARGVGDAERLRDHGLEVAAPEVLARADGC